MEESFKTEVGVFTNIKERYEEVELNRVVKTSKSDLGQEPGDVFHW